jgi:competence protein ComEC
MSDRTVAAVAAAAFLGACQPHAVSVVLLVAMGLATGAAALRRSPTALVVAVLFVASGLSSHAWNAIDFDVEATESGNATVVTDPERRGAATSAVLTVDGRRYLATAWGQAGWALAQADAGDRFEVSGRVGIYAGSRERIAALRTSHRLSLSSAERIDGGPVHYVLANAYRHLVEDGAVGLSSAQRGLYTGLVYGDDRNQDPLVAADFQGAGLTHLLAVSGQNVAYVLIMLTPLLARLGPRARWILSLVALALFATATRFEPSVLRASAMAALAVTGRLGGREIAPLRSLSIAVLVLVLVDPLLATTVAFRLSVGASAGIVLLTPRLMSRLPGPSWFRDPLAVTLGAQLAVAPILVGTFGPISLATVPANLLAGPVAGVAMMWGMTAGALGGLVGGRAAWTIQLPTRAFLWWLELVARGGAESPLPQVGMVGIAGIAVGSLALARMGRRARWGMALALVVAVLAWPSSRSSTALGWDSVLLREEKTLLVVGDDRSALALLGALRSRDVNHLDFAVVTEEASMATVALVAQRLPIAMILSPTQTGISEAVDQPITIDLGGVVVEVRATGHGLDAVLVRQVGSPP